VTIETITFRGNLITNFTQNSLCINGLKHHMVPSILDFGEGTLDCRFFCHLYMQLRLEKPISLQVRFNSKCRQNLGSLKAKIPNKIEFFSDYERNEMIDFNEGMCQSNEYYSCKSTNPSITTRKTTTKSEVESSKPITTVIKPTIITESESTESITTSTINQTESETTTKSITTTFTNATIKDTEIETTSENMTTVTVENQTIISNTKWQKIGKTTSVSNSELTTNNSIDKLKMLLFYFFIIFTILTFVIYVASMFLPINNK
jgi:hypothetical protein